MSRIILKKYPGTDEQHIVVGWDRPLATYYWQEFNKEPEGDDDSRWDGWEEMVRVAGYGLNELPTVAAFMDSVPSDLRPLMTDEVVVLLREHSMDPNTGSVIVDLTKEPTSYKVEVKTFGETRWASNAVRFATEAEAEAAAVDLAGRWTMVEHYRATPSDDPVNYKWENGKAVSV